MTLRQRIESDGFAVVEDVLDAGKVDELIAAFDAHILTQTHTNAEYAMRDVFNAVPETQHLLLHPRIVALAEALFDRPAFAVRCLFFDKVVGHNWPVGWHQDQVIAVKRRFETPGFGPWSLKAGAPHVQAPAAVLERMCAFRIHLDDCPEANGALRCVPGSHRLGRLDGGQAMVIRNERGAKICEITAGGVVLMKPLTLHASSSAQSPTHRRVIHIEITCDELPGEIEWFERRWIQRGRRAPGQNL